MLNSFVTKLGIYRFFDDFVVIYPLYVLMFENSGLSLSQISILLLVWSASSFILEVPSGVVADKYDRKTILIVAQISRIFGFLIWLLSPTFIGYLIGFVLWGIKSAFTSGTLDAYLYDGLEAEGKEDTYTKTLGRLKSLSFVAILLASGTASALFSLGYNVLLILSILALVISALALLFSKSEHTKKSTEEVEYFSLLSEGVGEVFKNSRLLILVIISSILVGVMAVDEYFSLFVNQVGISASMIGYLSAIYSVFQIIGSFFAHKFSSNNFLFVALLSFSALVLFIGLLGGVVGVVLFLILAFISSIGQVVSNAAIQNNTKGHVRATVSSVSGFLAEIMAFVVYVTFSVFPSEQVRSGLMFIGLIVLLLSSCLVVTSKLRNLRIYSA